MKKVLKSITNTAARTVKRGLHYHVDDATAMKSSHELAQKNPLLKKQWINGSINNTFQHPTIGRITCEKPECGTKLCDTPCATIKEKVYVGHTTHSEQYGKFISYDDLNGKKSPQYFAPYNPPIKNHDSAGINTNTSRTENLNQKNTNARAMIHIYSSHNPLDE